jgi:Tetratricopeptide repeat
MSEPTLHCDRIAGVNGRPGGMGVTLVTEVPGSRWPNRLITILARISAGILTMLSFVASISLCLVIPAVIPWFRRYIEWLPAVVVTHLGYSLLVALAILAAGSLTVPLARFSRREVLYLRRFGDAETARAVTDALPAIGHSWRLVALDDRTLKPVSVNRAFRWAASLVELSFGLSLGAASSLFGLAKKVGYPTLALLAFLLWRGEGTLQQRWEGVLHGGGLLYTISRIGVEVAIVLLVAAIVCFVFRWTMLPVFAVTFSMGTPDDADESAHGSIRFQGDIFRTQQVIRRNAKRTVAARIAVITVSDDLWRETVARLADDAAVVLVDVSQPTKHVIWEVEYLLEADIPCVFVGAASRLSYLTDHSHGGELGAILRDRLDGRTVVSYVPGRRKSARRAFARALRASFEQRGKPNPRSGGVYQALQHMVNKRSDKAIPIFERIALRRQETLGPDHAVTLYALRDLATAYQAARRRDEARVLFERILGAWEKQAHDDEANAARLAAREDLAHAYDVAGRTVDAHRFRTQNVGEARESLDGRQRALESGDPMALRAARNLANACQAAGLHHEGISLFKANLETCLRQGGNSRRNTATLQARDDLARAYGRAGQVAEALRLHTQNENEAKRILGRDHPLTREFGRSRSRAWRATRASSEAK